MDTAIRRLKIQVTHKGNISASELMTIFIFIIVFLSWILLNERFGLGIIAIGGAFLYLATGLVEWNQVSKNTNWGVILLFAGAISLGVQMKNTGTALWIGQLLTDHLVSITDHYSIIPYITNIFFTTILSNIMSSSATVAVLGPISLSMGGESFSMGMTTAISSAFGYFSVIAAPACMIIYSSGLIKIIHFLKAGWPMLIMSITCLLLIQNYYWPLIIKIITI